MAISVTVDPAYDRRVLNERLIQARNNLKHYPTLKKFADNFSFIPGIPYRKIRNIFFWLASDQFAKSAGILSNFEQCLNQLNVNEWSKTKRSELRAKITANRGEANWGILTEVQVAANLTEKFGKACVRYAPSLPSGKKCDTSALVNRRNIFFEVTAVNIGLVEHILTNIFDKAGQAIYQKIPTNVYLKLEVDTSRLTKSNKDFDVPRCVDQLVRSYVDLKVESFENVRGTIVVHVNDLQRLWEKDSELRDQLENVRQLEPELASRIEHGDLNAFSQLTPRAFENTPIASIWKMDGHSFKAVEISWQGIYPSKASLDEQSSFFRRLDRTIKSKVTGGQLSAGKPNILAIRASNWTLMGYERTGPFESVTSEFEFETIRPHLEQCLDELKPKDLSAIMLFENSFANAQVILNKYAKEGSRLTSGEINLLTSPRTVPLSPFMEFATETFDQAKIDRCLEALVQTYNGMSIVKKICQVQPFSQEDHAHLNFIQVGYRTRLPKSWFIDPTVYSQHIFADYGSAIAEGETRFILRQIAQNAVELKVRALNFEEIVHAVTKLSQNGSETSILLPLDLFVPIHSWTRADLTPVLSRREGGIKMTIDIPSSSPLEIPAYFLRKETEINGVIIYVRGHGTIVYKEPRPSEFLSAQLTSCSDDSTKLEMLAKSVLAYDLKNKSLAIVLMAES